MKNKPMALIYEEESYRILGACFEVYREKGCGFLEAVYQECLDIEFELQGIPAIPKPQLELTYKQRRLEQTYEADFVCFGRIVVELKAVSDLNDTFRAQVQNYLRSTGMKLGLLINFGHYPKLEHERIVL
jgi:GxxExxY protein